MYASWWGKVAKEHDGWSVSTTSVDIKPYIETLLAPTVTPINLGTYTPINDIGQFWSGLQCADAAAAFGCSISLQPAIIHTTVYDCI